MQPILIFLNGHTDWKRIVRAPMETLPRELVEHIFSYLPLRDYLRARATCRSWASIRYPKTLEHVDLCCAEYLMRRVVCTEYNYHRAHRSGKTDNVHVEGQPIDRACIIYTQKMDMPVIMPPTVRYLIVDHFSAPQITWTGRVRYIDISTSKVLLAGSWFPMGLECLVASSGTFIDEPLPPTIKALSVSLLTHQSLLHEGLVKLSCGRVGNEPLYRMPTTLRSLKIDQLWWARVQLNDDLRELVFSVMEGQPIIPLALQSFEGRISEESGTWDGMFPPTLTSALLKFDNAFERLGRLFRNGARAMTLYIQMYSANRFFDVGSFPSTLTDLEISILYSHGGKIFARGVLPASLRRLSLHVFGPDRFGRDVLHGIVLPDGLHEFELQYNTRDEPMIEYYPPSLRVLHSDIKYRIPDSVVTWIVNGGSDADKPWNFIKGAISKLQYVRLPKNIKNVRFSSDVRVSYY